MLSGFPDNQISASVSQVVKPADWSSWLFDGFFDGEVESGENDELITQVEGAIQLVLNDSAVTRGGKDRGAIRRGLEALLKQLKFV